MEIVNKEVFRPVVFVEEDEIDALMPAAHEMAQLAKKLHMASLTANQVGISKNLFVLEDGGKCNNFSIYVNLEIGEPETPIDQDFTTMPVFSQTIKTPIISASLPNKRLLLETKDRIHISVFDVEEQDRIEREVEGGESIIWQGIQYHLNGINQDDIVDPDFQTIRRTQPKRKPNSRCVVCGNKVKRCICE